MKKQQIISLTLGILLCILLIGFTDSAKAGVLYGLKLCYFVLIPSLFPFLIVGDLLAGAVSFVRLKTPLGRALGLTPCEYLLFLLSQIGGYPMGARLLQSGVENGSVNPARAKRLVCLFVGCGPGFAIGGVGGLLHNKNAGILLYVCCVLASFLCALLFSPRSIAPAGAKKMQVKTDASSFLVSSVQNGTTGMISICGFVVFFSMISAVLSKILPRCSWLLPYLEVGGGVNLLAKSSASLPLFGFLLGFGGLAVVLQIVYFGGNLANLGQILTFRLLCGGLCAALVKIALFVLPSQLCQSFAPDQVGVISPGSGAVCSALLVLFVISCVTTLAGGRFTSGDSFGKIKGRGEQNG